MSDFVQTMKDWRRMCATQYKLRGTDSCDGCPLESFGCLPIYDDEGNADYSVVEREVSKWAAEHPVDYPTWLEWLKSMGVIPYLMGIVVTRDEEGNFEHGHVDIKENALKPIPADIAQKLGIEPKEG